MLMEQMEKVNGLTLHTFETNKFKTNTIVLKLKAPLNEENVTKRALLPYVLQSGTTSFASPLKIRSYLDELYGASLQVDVSKKGEYQILSFRMDISNEKYLKDTTPLLEKAINLLSEILLDPVRDGSGFDGKIVENEKRSLKQRIESIYDDKMSYANMRLLEEMFENEPFRLQSNGNINDVEKITPQSLFDYYQQVLMEDEIDLYIIGDVKKEEVSGLVNSYFTLPEGRVKSFEKANVLSKAPAKAKEVKENQDIKQGKLHIGYRVDISYVDDDYFALQVFNGILGGFAHSKLFLNVREKESLAYYAASRLESHKGLLLIMSGIEFENYQKAVDIIKEQLEAMGKGDFTDAEIDQTKAVIRNQLLETIDTANGIVEIYYNNVIGGVNRPIEEWIERMEKVTREEIIEVAKKIKLDTIYFLKGLESA